jgi:hypothetical protein
MVLRRPIAFKKPYGHRLKVVPKRFPLWPATLSKKACS